MTRSDNIYPSYVKIEVDPNKPKAGWDDGCRRCANCGKSWPNLPIFSPSPCHNAVAGIVKTEKPDISWSDAVKALVRAKFDRYYDKWNEGLTDEELYWTNTENDVSVNEMSEGMREIERLISEGNHHAKSDR